MGPNLRPWWESMSPKKDAKKIKKKVHANKEGSEKGPSDFFAKKQMVLFDRWRQEGWDAVWLEFGRIGNGLLLQARVCIDKQHAM